MSREKVSRNLPKSAGPRSALYAHDLRQGTRQVAKYLAASVQCRIMLACPLLTKEQGRHRQVQGSAGGILEDRHDAVATKWDRESLPVLEDEVWPSSNPSPARRIPLAPQVAGRHPRIHVEAARRIRRTGRRRWGTVAEEVLEDCDAVRDVAASVR
jgi:hypothetical protein